MSRTWRRERTYEVYLPREEYDENQRYRRYVASKAPTKVTIGTIDDDINDARMSGDNTFTRDCHV